MKKTLVIGASEKPERYSNMATKMLLQHGHQVVLLGNKSGRIASEPIETEIGQIDDLDTVTMYVSAQNQDAYKDLIVALHPKRVIFNPGTENPAFEQELLAKGVEAEEACTLVLLQTGQY